MAAPRPPPVTRSPRQRTLASLWARVMRASHSVRQSAARTPGILLAAIDMPMPVPQTRMPKRALPEATSRDTATAKSG